MRYHAWQGQETEFPGLPAWTDYRQQQCQPIPAAAGGIFSQPSVITPMGRRVPSCTARAEAAAYPSVAAPPGFHAAASAVARQEQRGGAIGANHGAVRPGSRSCSAAVVGATPSMGLWQRMLMDPAGGLDMGGGDGSSRGDGGARSVGYPFHFADEELAATGHVEPHVSDHLQHQQRQWNSSLVSWKLTEAARGGMMSESDMGALGNMPRSRSSGTPIVPAVGSRDHTLSSIQGLRSISATTAAISAASAVHKLPHADPLIQMRLDYAVNLAGAGPFAPQRGAAAALHARWQQDMNIEQVRTYHRPSLATHQTRCQLSVHLLPRP